MFTEPDTFHCFVCLMLYVFSFYSITPLCPYYVCSNPIMIIFSVDGPVLLFYRTEHNYSVFCNQKQGSIKNVNAGNLYGATYFFLARFARSVFKTLINDKMYCTIRHNHKSIHHIVY